MKTIIATNEVPTNICKNKKNGNSKITGLYFVTNSANL